MKPYYRDEAADITLYHGDCLTVMRSLPDASVDLIVADPPYFRVKDEWWDRQWDTAEGFLAWVGRLCAEWRRLLRPNGSLYVFASPKMAARVELEIGKVFNVLSSICWVKHDGSGAGTGGHSKACKEELRTYFSQTERIIFAEHRDAQSFLKTARLRRGLSCKDLTGVIGAHGAINHGGAVSNWESGLNTPSKEQYERMAGVLDLPRYDEAIRPFKVSPSVPYTDAWDFLTVRDYPGKHPCEKPIPLLTHIIEASSRPGALVLDPTCGSGSTLMAAREAGRWAVGIEVDGRWAKRARRRLEQGVFAWED